MKKLLAIFAIIMLSIICFGWIINNKSSLTDYQKRRTALSYASDILPAIETLPAYKEIKYRYKRKWVLIYSSESIVLNIIYDEENYNTEKEKLNEQFNFLAKDSRPSNFDRIPESDFEINSYSFRVIESIKGEKSDFYFPKYFGMIAVSDEKKSIAYLYFLDFELDDIASNSMAKFVKEYFNFKW